IAPHVRSRLALQLITHLIEDSMSEPTSNSPLQEAQQLVVQLREQVGTMDANDLKSRLAKINDLLQGALTRGEGQDAASLRQQMNTGADQTASFNSMMVHEIRKPMTSIRGYTDMLAKPGMIGPMNETQQQFIDT